jgi:hypothetical protein
MFENRIGKFFESEQTTGTSAGVAPAFIACPLPLLVGYSQAQQSYVAEVYRRAQELTEAQMRKPARRRAIEFSLN